MIRSIIRFFVGKTWKDYLEDVIPDSGSISISHGAVGWDVSVLVDGPSGTWKSYNHSSSRLDLAIKGVVDRIKNGQPSAESYQ